MATTQKDNKIYVTESGLKKLQDELKYLKDAKRVEIAEKLKEAISFWDLSENSEYEEARSEQAQVEHRILELDEQLKNIAIIDEDNKNFDRVNMGDTVTIENLADKETSTYKLVGSTESDILSELPKISNESPIGQALLGKKKGTTVKAKTPGGTFEYKIVDIT